MKTMEMEFNPEEYGKIEPISIVVHQEEAEIQKEMKEWLHKNMSKTPQDFLRMKGIL